MSEKLKSIEQLDRPPVAPAEVPDNALDVLLVEDEPDIRRLLAHVIHRAGHRVAEAATLREAEAQLAGADWDILVVDARLPDGSGVPLAVQAAHHGIKVVIMSGDTNEMARMRDAGIMYVRKPFRPDDLAIVIERLVRRSALQAM